MKSKELIEILNVEPDAEVLIQTQFNWPMYYIRSCGFGEGPNGEKNVYLRLYDLEACIATAEAKDVANPPAPLSETHSATSAALKALDSLGVALAAHGHAWTPEERDSYDKAVELLTGGGGGFSSAKPSSAEKQPNQ